MRPNVFTVSQVDRYIRGLLEDDVILGELFVEAEISNLTLHTSGHAYFTLKDENAALNAVMFKSHAGGLTFRPENGMRVVVFGRVSLYEKTGQVQFYAELMEPAGVGALYVAFQQLKDKLAAEGLFDQALKRKIPSHPACVAVVTSPGGAALRDIIQIAKRRHRGVSLVVAPAQVQGDGAAESVAAAIKLVNEWGRADVIIVGRGGGSAEDLWAFNEEAVARAIRASKIPVISAVGHETDFTIADMAADLRAPTPSAAAELAVPNARESMALLHSLRRALHALMANALEEGRAQLAARSGPALARRLLAATQDGRARLARCDRAMGREWAASLARSRLALEAKAARLQQLSPLAPLTRGLGFALARDASGAPVRCAGNVRPGQALSLEFHDGTVMATVEEVMARDG